MTEDEKEDLIFNALYSGTLEEWEQLLRQFPDFPCGYSHVYSRTLEEWEQLLQQFDFPPCAYNHIIDLAEKSSYYYWINEAIDRCPIEAVKWLIDKGANLRIRDAEGYMPLHCCLCRDLPDKYEMLQLLIDNGADINAGTDLENGMMGTNSWTPLHMAAAWNDLEAIRILLNNGADTTLRTIIDNYATPEEEARIMGNNEAAELIKNYKFK